MPFISDKRGIFRDKTFRVHLICWIVLVFYEVVLSGIYIGQFHRPLQYFLFYTINIGLFYFHALWVMPWITKTRRSIWWRLPVFLSMELIMYCFFATLNILLIYSIYDLVHGPVFSHLDYQLFAGFLFRAINFLMLGTGYYYLMRYIRGQARESQQQAEIAKLGNQLVQAELDFLRAQVNPHLLFNTLSYIQHVAKTRPADAEQAMDSLSKLMDYSLGSYNKDGVPLGEEINYAEQIIRIHQLRYGDTLKLVYTKEIADDRVMVPPLTLVTLVENLFKHGHLAHVRSPAHIRVYADEFWVVFETANIPRKMGSRQQIHPPSGLKNLTERLEMAVPNRHRFTHGMDGDIFKARLELSKDEIR